MKSHLSVLLSLTILGTPLSAAAQSANSSTATQFQHPFQQTWDALYDTMKTLDQEIKLPKYTEMTNMERLGFIAQFSKIRQGRGQQELVYEIDDMDKALRNFDRYVQTHEDYAALMRQYKELMPVLNNPRLGQGTGQARFQTLTHFENLLKSSQSNDWKSVKSHFKAIPYDSPLYWRALNQVALAQIHTGQLREAYQNASRTIALMPRNAHAYFIRGYALALGQQHGAALADYDKAISFDRENALYYNNRGYLYQKMGNFPKAIANYNSAIALNAQEDSYLSNRGETYHLMGKYPNARADFSKALELNPRKGFYYFSRGNAFLKEAMYRNAVNDYTEAIEHGLTTPWVYHNRGYAYHQLKHNPKALHDLNTAVAKSPQTTHFYKTRSQILNTLLAFAPMGRDYQIITQRAPSAQAFFGRGNAAMHHRQYASAISSFSQAIEFDNKFGMAYFYRGQSYRELGQCEKANSDFSLACSLGAKDACNHYCEEGLGPTRHMKPPTDFTPLKAPASNTPASDIVEPPKIESKNEEPDAEFYPVKDDDSDEVEEAKGLLNEMVKVQKISALSPYLTDRAAGIYAAGMGKVYPVLKGMLGPLMAQAKTEEDKANIQTLITEIEAIEPEIQKLGENPVKWLKEGRNMFVKLAAPFDKIMELGKSDARVRQMPQKLIGLTPDLTFEKVSDTEVKINGLKNQKVNLVVTQIEEDWKLDVKVK